MEIALLRIGIRWHLQRDRLLEYQPEVRIEAFDPKVMMMATVHEEVAETTEKQEKTFRVVVKGAPEAVLDANDRVLSETGAKPMDDEIRHAFMTLKDEMPGNGLRVLAAADKTVSDADAGPYEELIFLGLIGMHDPPREEVPEAIEACRQAGIRVVMVTGDQAPTAAKICRMIGLMQDNDDTGEIVPGRQLQDMKSLGDAERRRLLTTEVFARVSPEQKLNLITLHQENGDVVAMTGDGVNDAPALKKADIGIAMGKLGTQVARQAADMVLSDDAFGTIVTAIV
jgi:Ca2+-transporting ATPase